MIYNLLNMALLLWVGKRFANWLKNGDIFLVYLIVYPVGRFFLEYLRLDPSPLGTINANQTLMGIIALSAAAALVLRHVLGKKSDRQAQAAQLPEEQESDNSSIE
jgi:phosphatidylglycerol:prolipoprotein diacylglycerol transferase